MPWTNRGKQRNLEVWVGGGTVPTNLYVALLTSATAVGPDIVTMSSVTEVGTGTGYTQRGFQLTPGATDFDVISINDPSDFAFAQIKDVSWTASGGQLPNGNSARYAALTDDNATPSAAEIYMGWDLGSDRAVSDTQTLTLQNLEFRIT